MAESRAGCVCRDSPREVLVVTEQFCILTVAVVARIRTCDVVT